MRDPLSIERAKQMRREPTALEYQLWLAVRAKRFEGAKFRRQVVIGRYIVDFACRLPTMLVIELDGDTHGTRVAYDAERTAFLERQGYHVLRFTNHEVRSNLEGVLTAIAAALPLSPALSPEGEREKEMTWR